MKDRLGNKLKVGDWILYIPKSVSFLEGHRICQIVAFGADELGERCATIEYQTFEYHLYPKHIEKLSDDPAEREQYVFLKTLELQ